MSKISLSKLVKSRIFRAVLILDKNKSPLASGVFIEDITEAWYIITNKHVVKASSPIYISLNFSKGARFSKAEVVEEHPSLDLAAIVPRAKKFPETPLIKPIFREEFSPKKHIIEGESVFYIGFPLGLGAEYYNFPVVEMA